MIINRLTSSFKNFIFFILFQIIVFTFVMFVLEQKRKEINDNESIRQENIA
jgi:cbb3-type cytochrome oxidase subunit 3